MILCILNFRPSLVVANWSKKHVILTENAANAIPVSWARHPRVDGICSRRLSGGDRAEIGDRFLMSETLVPLIRSREQVSHNDNFTLS